EANQGYSLATSSEMYNRQFHQKEMEFINNQDNINKFKQILQKNNQDIKYSDKEVISILAKAGISLNDKSFNETYNKNLSNDELNKINLAREFIKQSSFYNTNLGQTNAFNPTLEQYNDRYMYASNIYNNNQEFYKNYLYINPNSSLFDYIKHYTKSTAYSGVGLVEGAYDGAVDIGNIILHPVDTISNIFTTIINPSQAVDAISLSINEFNSKNFIDSIISDQSSINRRTYNIAGEILLPLVASSKAHRVSKLNSVNKFDDVSSGGMVGKNTTNDTASKNLNISKNNKIIFSDKQLQKKLKHANDFNLPTSYTKKNLLNFKNAINDHINSITTTKIDGTYR
uniref:colicin D domain-containing protein n=1 Tax=Campylobacter sputorum TaxID=206 RepID=UPI00053BF104